MMYISTITAFVIIFIITFLGTMFLDIIFRYLGKRGYLGNLYPNVRGGIPRSIGLIPFLVLSFYFLPGFNSLVLIIGIFAFFDDIVGRHKIPNLDIEWGQLSRGIGMLILIIAGVYMGLGWSSIFIALLVQPINISDMQPGSTCMVAIIMGILTIICMLIVATAPIDEIPAIYSPLVLILVCIAYSPLDFAGKIMLGEVGNHSIAVALGISFYLIGGFWWLISLSVVTVCLTAFVRRNTLKLFLNQKLKIRNPTFGDYFMDVLTGGGLGDLFRRIILKHKQYTITNPILILLGFRRLLYNPYAPNNDRFESNHKSPKVRLQKF